MDCLDSIVCQDYQNYGVFIVDDGSTDSSVLIAQKYCDKDERFRLIVKKNGGVSSARNVALREISECTGRFDYVLFLDSDDVWEKDCLACIAGALRSTGSDAIQFGVQPFDRNGFIGGGEDHPLMVLDREGAFFFCFDKSNKKYARSSASSNIMDTVGFSWGVVKEVYFDESLQRGEDQDFKIRVLQKCEMMTVIGRRLVRYRLRRGSLAHTDIFSVNDLSFFLHFIRDRNGLSEPCCRLLQERALDTWWNYLRVVAEHGNLDACWQEFVRAEKMIVSLFDPAVLKLPKVRKRLSLFSMGRRFIKIYFILLSKKAGSVTMENYFQ